MGLALLAFSPDDTVTRTIESERDRHTQHIVAAPDRLRQSLAVIRLTRVAKFESDVHSVAMPVFGPGGKVVAAIELALCDPDQDVGPAVSILTIASRSLSRELSSETQNVHSTPFRLVQSQYGRPETKPSRLAVGCTMSASRRTSRRPSD